MEVLLVVFITVVVATTTWAQTANFANNLERCTASKPIDICLRATLEELRTLMPVGIKELGLNATEPLQIENLKFNEEAGPVRINTVFKNVVVRGLSKFRTEEIRADTASRRLFIRLSVPEIDIKGTYIIDGNVFFLPINGNGPFTTKLGGVTATGGAEIVPIGPINDQKLSIRNTDIDFQISRIHIKMDNLFGGTEDVLSESVNKFLNENSDLVLEEIKPKIRDQMVNLVERVMNNAFSKLSANEILQNIQSRTRGRRQFFQN